MNQKRDGRPAAVPNLWVSSGSVTAFLSAGCATLPTAHRAADGQNVVYEQGY